MKETIDQEWALLIALCNFSLGNLNSQLNFDAKSIKWNRLFQYAKVHKIRPCLNKGLFLSKIEVPTNFKNRLHQEVLQISMFNLNQVKELSEIIEIFKTNDIKIIPYKGAVLAKRIFGEYNSREFSDIDFLIYPKDLDAIGKILKNRNYQEQTKVPKWWKRYHKFNNCEFNYDKYSNEKRLFHLEPHWVLSNHYLQGQIKFDQVQALTRSVPFINDNKINLLNCEGLLLTTMLHHTRDQCSSLKHCVDIAGIVNYGTSEIDWPRLIRIATEWKVRNLLLFGLAITQVHFKIEIPQFVDELIKQNICPKTLSQSKDFLYENTPPGGFKRQFRRIIFQLKVRQYWSTKIKVLYYTFVYFLSFRPLNSKITQTRYTKI